ncbi:MAG: adenosine deaminase [Ruminococcus sp.]|jgi:adenosine deaminase
MEYKQLKKYPKLELHCHLDGSLSLEFIRERLGEQIPLSALQVKEDCRNLSEYLEKFALPLRCLQDEEGLMGAGYDFIKNAAGENVRYVEVRFAPGLSREQGLTVKQILESLLKGLEKGRENFGVNFNVIVCAMRQHSEEDNLNMLKEAAEFLGYGVCAADLAGDEAAYPMKKYFHLFQEAKKLGYPFTIHAGECGNPDNIRDSLAVGAVRIGHGIAMKSHRRLQEMCRENHIGIEMCPVSNLQTKASPSQEEYPLREFLEAGLLVSINTDNRTVSGSSVTKELDFIQKTYRVSDEEIRLFMINAVKTAFADDSIKEKLYRLYV